MSVDRVSLLASIATDVLNVDGVSPNNHGSQAAHVVDTAADQAMTIGVDEDYPADLKPASNMYEAQAVTDALSVEGMSPFVDGMPPSDQRDLAEVLSVDEASAVAQVVAAQALTQWQLETLDRLGQQFRRELSSMEMIS